MSGTRVQGEEAQGRKAERGIGQFIVYLIILVFVIGAGLRWRSQQEFHGLRISGLHYMNESEIRSVLDSTLLPRKMSDIRLHDIRSAVLRVPYVQNAVVQRSNENEIEIQVTERKPLALIVRAGGDMQYVDDQSVILPYRVLQNGSDVPILRGIDRNGSIDSSVLQHAGIVLNELRNEESSLVFNDISELRYSEEERSYSFESSADGTKILFGGFENHSEKVRNLCSLIRYTGQQNDQGAASLIDLRWSNKVFVTRRNAQH